MFKLKNSLPIYIGKNEKALCSEQNTKVVAKDPLDKEISTGVKSVLIRHPSRK